MNNKLKSGKLWERIVCWAVSLCLIGAAIYTTATLITTPEGSWAAENPHKTKANFTLMTVQCLGAFVLCLLPVLLRKVFRLELPPGILMYYYLFMFCAAFLGEVFRFYYAVPHWDDILHISSGAVLAIVGYSIVNACCGEGGIERLPAGFAALCAFMLALSFGVIWEFYEFTADGLLGMNMQKFALEDGTNLIGRAALIDTMKDLIVDFVGAAAGALSLYAPLKHKKPVFQAFLIRHLPKEEPSA
ncbi:MAG: hypothetical protein KH334_03600 [Clostridiales bacterium]|nr:hypothetical protein [Clostridiales bacterium]